MAESRRFSLTPQLDINQILKEAQKRWLRPPEICEILLNYRKFRIAPEPANRPPSGSLFLFDRKVLRYFRKDGHNWRKKKDGKTVKEAHERLKVGSVDVLHCYYAHGEENENFQRRSYWMLEGDYMHIVLVHYLEIKGSKASYIRTREAEEYAQVVHVDSPSCSSSFTNPSQPPFPVSDAGSPISTETSEYEDADSDNYQASSRYHSLLKMQQYGNEPVREIHLLNSYSQFPPLTNQYAHHRQQPTRPGSEVYSVGQEDAISVFDDTGIGQTFSVCRTQFGSTSWKQVFEHCSDFQSAPLDPTISSTRDAVLDQPTQNSSTIGEYEEFFADDLGFEQNDIANTQVKSVWQLDNAEVDPLVSHINGEVDNSMEGNPTYASLIKQLSLDITTEGEGLKKNDSFSRWMSNEFGEVDDSHLKSNSEVYWSVDDSGISNEQLDAYLVGPSISQEQLYSIIDFSPHWAYAGMETEVIITGKCLKNKEEVRNCKWSCMFGEIEVPADILADGTLCCCAPPHKSGRVPFYVTCSNRLACSEVREFEYREQSTQYMESFDSYINMVNDMDLHKRLDKLIDMDSFDHSKLASRITSDKQKLMDEINSVMREVDDEWFNVLKPLHEEALPSDIGAESLVDRLLKDKLHTWLINKVIEDGKGPNVLDKDGQGVIHLAAALGYDWVMKPVVTSGVSVNFRDAHGWTALHWAAFCGRLRTVATLIRLDAASGALTDPTPEFPSGRTPADLASGSGHKGIAGFLAESSLTSHLLALNLKESEGGAVPEVSDLTGVEDIAEPSSVQPFDGDIQDQPFDGDIQDGLSLKDSLSAVRKATQAAARIHQVFRVESFQRKKLTESGDGERGISDERALSLISFKTAKSRQQDLPVHAAATKIQNKFRGWKGRKEFLVIRQRIIKIQAHVRGHQVRKHYKKIVWTVGIMEKIILRWRRKGSGLRGFRSEGLIEGPSMQDEPTKDDEYDFLKEGRKQTELRLEKALARVKSMVQYPEARDQYRRLMTVVNELQETKAGVMEEELEEESGDGDFMIGLEELWEDDTFMPAL